MNIPQDMPAAGEEQLVVALFGDQAAAEQAITALQQAGFGQEQIGTAARQQQPLMSPEAEAALDQEAEATGTGVAVGGVAGSAAGIATGAALGSIGGPLGSVIGGVVGALVGTTAGSALGELLGERSAHHDRFGVPQQRVEQYNTALQGGQIAVSVHARSANDVMRAREVLSRFADEIDVHMGRDARAAGGQEGMEPGI